MYSSDSIRFFFTSQIKSLYDLIWYHQLHSIESYIRLELARSKVRLSSTAAEKSQNAFTVEKAERFRRSRLLLAALSPWIRLIDQARYGMVCVVLILVWLLIFCTLWSRIFVRFVFVFFVYLCVSWHLMCVCIISSHAVQSNVILKCLVSYWADLITWRPCPSVTTNCYSRCGQHSPGKYRRSTYCTIQYHIKAIVALTISLFVWFYILMLIVAFDAFNFIPCSDIILYSSQSVTTSQQLFTVVFCNLVSDRLHSVFCTLVSTRLVCVLSFCTIINLMIIWCHLSR